MKIIIKFILAILVTSLYLTCVAPAVTLSASADSISGSPIKDAGMKDGPVRITLDSIPVEVERSKALAMAEVERVPFGQFLDLTEIAAYSHNESKYVVIPVRSSLRVGSFYVEFKPSGETATYGTYVEKADSSKIRVVVLKNSQVIATEDVSISRSGDGPGGNQLQWFNFNKWGDCMVAGGAPGGVIQIVQNVCSIVAALVPLPCVIATAGVWGARAGYCYGEAGG